MIELVFNSPDMQTLKDDAVRLGFADENGDIIVSGPTLDGGGYFLNVVGDVYTPTGATEKDAFGNDVPVMAKEPGVWGRLRVNGGAENIPQFSPEITKYHYITAEDGTSGWFNVADDTPAPDFVPNVGVIA